MLNKSLVSLLGKCWNIGQHLFWLGVGLFGLGVLAWYMLRWWPGDRLLPVRLFNYFMPWLLVSLIPGLVLARLARRKWASVALAVPTLLISLTFAPLFLPRPEAVLAANVSFKMMSYNVWHRNKNLVDATRLIRQEQPDILLLQEVRSAGVQILTEELADLYPGGQLHFVYEPRVYQAAISRYPLTLVDTIYEKGRVQKISVETPVGPIAVWNVHTSQPLPWRRQYRQISALAEDIATTDGPLIVAGDFNTTDQSETYGMVNQYLENAHWEAGWGFGFTFPAHQLRFKKIPVLTPVVRIDHIFYSPHFFVSSAHTLSESGGSDHLPVVAELTLVK